MSESAGCRSVQSMIFMQSYSNKSVMHYIPNKTMYCVRLGVAVVNSAEAEII